MATGTMARKKILTPAQNANPNMKWLLIISVILVACSPYRRIHIKNESGGNAQVKWTLKENDSLPHNPFYLYSSTEVKFDLQPQSPLNELKLSMGMGSWSDDTLAMMIRGIESLEITSPKQKIKLDTSQIYSYLVEHRKGFGKRKIQIIIRD